MFLKTSQHSQENIFSGVIKNFIKKILPYRYFPVNLRNFSKKLFYRTPLDDCSNCFVRSKVLFIHQTSFVFSFYYWLLQLWESVHRGYKNEDSFYFLQLFIKNQLEFCLDNFSSATVCRSTEYRFPSKREWQLPNAEINFEGCISVKFFKKKKKYKFSKFLLLSLPGILVIKSPKEKEKL